MNEFQHRIAKKERVLAVVKPPRHFVKVGCQMLRRNPMPCSHDAAFQERECGLYGVRVDVAVHVLFAAVIDSLVRLLAVVFLERPRIRRVLVRHDHVNVIGDVFLDVLRQCPVLASSA